MLILFYGLLAELSFLFELLYNSLKVLLLFFGILYLLLQDKLLCFLFLLQLFPNHCSDFRLEVINIIKLSLSLLEIRQPFTHLFRSNFQLVSFLADLPQLFLQYFDLIFVLLNTSTAALTLQVLLAMSLVIVEFVGIKRDGSFLPHLVINIIKSAILLYGFVLGR